MQYHLLDFIESLSRISLSAKPKKVLYAFGKAGSINEWDGGFVVKLKNGKIAFITGWCDTAGWVCRGDATVIEVDSIYEVPILIDRANEDKEKEGHPLLPKLEEMDQNPVGLNQWI